MAELDIRKYFPSELKITEITDTPQKIIIKLYSQTSECICPNCGEKALYITEHIPEAFRIFLLSEKL